MLISIILIFEERGEIIIKQKGLKFAYVSAVLNAVIIGFSFLFTKIALEHAHPIDALMYRFAVAFVVISIPVMCGLVRLQYRGKSLYKVLPLAIMYPFGFFTFQTFGLEQATSAEGGILYAFTPVMTMLLAIAFLKETITVLQKLSISLSVFGVVFIFMMKGSNIDESNIIGIFLLFLSCLTFAGYSVLARSLLRKFSPIEITYLMLGIGFIAFLVMSFVEHMTSRTLERLLVPLTNGTFIMSILFLGVMSSLVTALTANYTLSKIEASKMSVFANVSVIVSVVAGAIFLEEPITVYHIIGSVLIITGVVGTNLRPKRSRSIVQQTTK